MRRNSQSPSRRQRIVFDPHRTPQACIGRRRSKSRRPRRRRSFHRRSAPPRRPERHTHSDILGIAPCVRRSPRRRSPPERAADHRRQSAQRVPRNSRCPRWRRRRSRGPCNEKRRGPGTTDGRSDRLRHRRGPAHRAPATRLRISLPAARRSRRHTLRCPGMKSHRQTPGPAGTASLRSCAHRTAPAAAAKRRSRRRPARRPGVRRDSPYRWEESAEQDERAKAPRAPGPPAASSARNPAQKWRQRMQSVARWSRTERRAEARAPRRPNARCHRPGRCAPHPSERIHRRAAAPRIRSPNKARSKRAVASPRQASEGSVAAAMGPTDESADRPTWIRAPPCAVRFVF